MARHLWRLRLQGAPGPQVVPCFQFYMIPPPVAQKAVPPREFAALADFPDRLSPMLVKELRQGLRARVFVVPFMIMHALLALAALRMSTSGVSPGSAGAMWAPLIIVVVFGLPLRNLQSLSDERELNTMDTLVLTNMSAWRIVVGKWLSTLALSALVVLSVIPYLTVQAVVSAGPGLPLAVLVIVFIWSGTMAAAATLMSWAKGQVFRISGIVGFGFSVWLGLWKWVQVFDDGHRSSKEWVSSAVVGAVLTPALLVAAASLLDPRYVARRRLALLGLTLCAAVFSGQNTSWPVAGIPLLLVAAFGLEYCHRDGDFQQRRIPYWQAAHWAPGAMLAVLCLGVLCLSWGGASTSALMACTGAGLLSRWLIPGTSPVLLYVAGVVAAWIFLGWTGSRKPDASASTLLILSGLCVALAGCVRFPRRPLSFPQDSSADTPSP